MAGSRPASRAVAAVAVVVAGLLFASCGRSTGSSAGIEQLRFTTLDGKAATLSELRGTPTVLNVWQQTCGPCKVEMPAIEAVHRSLGDRVRFVGVDSQDDPAAARTFAASIGITYDLWMDPDGEVLSRLELASIPATVFLDATGHEVARHVGALTEQQLRDQISTAFGSAS